MATLIILSISNILCFFIGAKVGQKVVNNEPIELPTINPVEIYAEHKEKEEVKKEISDLETMLENVNNYDGTTLGQKKL